MSLDLAKIVTDAKAGRAAATDADQRIAHLLEQRGAVEDDARAGGSTAAHSHAIASLDFEVGEAIRERAGLPPVGHLSNAVSVEMTRRAADRQAATAERGGETPTSLGDALAQRYAPESEA